MAETPEWFKGSLCAQEKTELFYSDAPADQREAKLICFRCPVQAECLLYAIEREPKYGVWGGTLPSERRKMRNV